MNLDYTGNNNPYGLIQKQYAGKRRRCKTRCKRNCKCHKHSCKICMNKRKRTRKYRKN